MNKKSQEDTLMTWVVSILLWSIIIIIFLAVVFIRFGEKNSLEERKIDDINNKEFLIFLNTEIELNGKKTRIINGIENSLDGFFEIKNEDGESFIEVFGIKGFNENREYLRDRMTAEGFDDEDWDSYLEREKEIQDGELIRKIIEELEKRCNINRWDRYLLELPFGVVTSDGLKLKEAIGEDSFQFFEHEIMKHKTNYRREMIEVELKMLASCEDE